jgi:HSP20 family protein
MALTPWRPLGELSSLRREMDRLLERFFGEAPSPELSGGTWEPRLNISETKDALTIKAELPGLESKDLDVSVSGDALTIKGEKKQEKEEKDEQRHVVERSYGAFLRMVRLPASVAQDKIKASFKNGVLTISLPKTEEAKQKAIPVTVE